MIANINGTSIHYIHEGDRNKEAIVLIHGFPFHHQMWSPQVQELSKSYQVIAYDLRGHGKSAQNEGPYMIEEHVDDLFALCEHAKIEKPIVAGLSMGGYIALRAVERNEPFFGGLILCDTKSEADTSEGKLKRFQTIKDIKTKGVLPFAEGFLKNIITAKDLTSNHDLVDRIRNMVIANSLESITGHLLALAARTDTTPSLSKFKLPTMILVGDQDVITTPANAHAMHEKIKHSELYVIPNAGHMSNLENPQMFNKYIQDFLSKINSSI